MSGPRSRLVCERVRSQLSLGLDGELSELERASVAAHLDRCPACQVYERDVDAVTARLRSAPYERLERPIAVPYRRRLRLPTLQVGAAAAAATLIVGVGSLLTGLSTERAGGPADALTPSVSAYVVGPVGARSVCPAGDAARKQRTRAGERTANGVCPV